MSQEIQSKKIEGYNKLTQAQIDQLSAEQIFAHMLAVDEEMTQAVSTLEKMNKNKQKQDRLIANNGEISAIEQLSKEWQQMFDTLSPQDQANVSGLPVLKSGIRYLPLKETL